MFTGEDGGVWSARVKTAGCILHHPVTKICLLEKLVMMNDYWLLSDIMGKKVRNTYLGSYA